MPASPSEEAGPRDGRESELLRREFERRLDWWICGTCFFLLPLMLAWWVA